MQFIENYFSVVKKLIINQEIKNNLYQLKDFIINCSNNNGSVYLIGNGGSSSTASHVSVDLTKNAKIRSFNFNEANLITCLSNDYSYEDLFTEALKLYSNNKHDLIILLSCSGNSQNLVNIVKWSNLTNRKVVTLTGSDKNNKLIIENELGLNLWVDSKSYNIIEIIHHSWLLSIVDLIIGKTEYPVTPIEYTKL